jgi:hypothetical protein
VPLSGQGHLGDVHSIAAGSGTNAASWTFTVIPRQAYRIAATWTPPPNHATDAPFRIYDGATLLATVRRNQERAPDDLTDAAGQAWEYLGEMYTISGTTLRVALGDNAVGIERLPEAPKIFFVFQQPRWPRRRLQ